MNRMKRLLVLGVAVSMAYGCGGEGGSGQTAATTGASSSQATTIPPPVTVTVAPTEGLPEEFPPELVPPGVTSSEWEPTGAGTDVWFDSTAGFEDVIDFYTNALEPPLGIRLDEDEGVNKAIWVYRPGVENITVIVTETDPLRIKVSGLF